jgi:hypothetical protein
MYLFFGNLNAKKKEKEYQNFILHLAAAPKESSL